MASVDDFLSAYAPSAGGGAKSQPAAGPQVQDPDAFLKQFAPANASGVDGQTMGQAQGATVPQQTGWARALGLGKQAIAGGLANGLGLPGDLEQLGVKYLANPIARYFGGTGENVDNAQSPGNQSTVFPTSGQMMAKAKAAGLVGDPSLVPGAGTYSEAEKLGTAALGGAASALPYAVTGGLGMLAAGGVGGTTAEGTHELMPDSTVAPLIAGAVGGLATGGIVAKIGAGVQARGLARAADAAESQATQAAAALASARDDLALTKLTNPADLDAIRASSKKLADAAVTHAGAQAQAAAAQAEPVVAGVRASLGTSATPQQAGSALQDSARDWLANVLPARMEALWGPVDQAIPAGTTVARDGFSQALQSITTKAGGNQPLVDALSPGLPRRLQAIFAPEGHEVTEAGVANVPQSWKDAQRLRSAIGNAMSNPQVIRDIPQQDLARLYAAQTEDMRGALGGLPPAADGTKPLDLFSRANSESARLYDIAQGPISRVVSGKTPSLANDPKPEDVATRLLSGGTKGASDLQVLREEIPAGVDELAAAHLAGPKPWAGLSPEAQAALVPDAAQQQQLHSAIGSAEAAQAHAKTVATQAAQAHRDRVAQAVQASKDQVLSKSLNVRQLGQDADAARSAADAAKAAIPVKANPWTLRDLQHSLMAPEAGSAIGALAHGLVPGITDLQGGAAGMLAGMVIPPAIRGAAAIAQNPAMLRYPAQGLLSGNNALMPGGQ